MKILCIDSNSIANRAFYGIKLLSTKEGIYTNAIYGFMNIVLKLCADYSPDKVIFTFDLRAPTFRHKKFDGYKAGRKAMPEELVQQMPILKELLATLGYPILEIEGYEADDILGTLASLGNIDNHIYIATGDRDSLQLVSDNTTVLLAGTKMGQTTTTVCTPAYIDEKYGIAPKQLIDVKALMGDASDNIPGVAGIGEKTALKLIIQWHTLDDIYTNIDNLCVSKGITDKLINGKEAAYMSRELAEIYTSVPIDMNLDTYTTTPVNEGAAFALLSKLEMSSTIKRLGLTAVQNTDSIVEISTMPAVTPLKISADIDKLLALTQTDKLLFVLPVYINDGNDISALGVCCDDIIYLIDDTNSRFIELYTAVLKSNNPKVTYDCKSLYNLCFAKDFTAQNIIFDILLAAYLLSANSDDYSPAILIGEYKVNWAVEQSFPQEYTVLVESLAQITALYPIMEKEITVNKQDKLLHEIEIPLSKVLSSMERIGFLIDKQGIKQYGDMINQKLTEHEKEIYRYSGTEFNINSPKQLGEILFEKLELPAKKKTKTGYSTNADVLEYLKPYHPIIPEILEYRKLAKLKSTYIEGLLKVIGDDGRIHTHLNQTDTKTGRLSSSEPNMQNIPVRTEIGSQLRRFFIADKGKLLVDADYSQIELRVLAHISKDENMIEAFQNDEDIHTNTAAQVFDLPPLFITPEMRSKAKAVNFGIVYGIGAFSLSQDIGVTVKEADNYIKGYLNTYPGVKQYMADIIAFAKENGFVTTLFNRRRYLPEITASNKNMQAFGQRVAMNTPIQGTAADIIKIAMVRVYNRLEREGLKSKLILQIHDELIIEAPLDEADIAAKLVREEMQTAIELSVHLDVDIGSGKSWYDAK